MDGGVILNPVNLLQTKRRNSFLANGTATQYVLDSNGLDSDLVTAVVNGITITEGNGLTVNRITGVVTFSVAPVAPSTVGQDNVIITFSKTTPGYATRIKRCLLSCIFDNRIFLSGNKELPNALFHSELDDPTYISDLSYYQDGSDNVPITGLLRVGNSIMVLKLDDQHDATVFYHEPNRVQDPRDTTGRVFITTYPTQQGLAGIGNISMWGCTNFLDDTVFISRLGLERFTKLNLGWERAIEHTSTKVDNYMINEKNFENIHLEEWNGYLMCLANGKIYLADNRQRYLHEGTRHIEYEWYYWNNIGDYINDEFKPAILLKEFQGNLYFGTENGVICQFTNNIYNDNGRLIYCCWRTPYDNFSSSNHLKTTNKRGGIALLKRIPNNLCKLQISTDRNDNRFITRHIVKGFSYKDFIYNNFSYRVRDKSFMKFKIKEKKWIFISLLFFSDEIDKPFGIYNITLESFVGRYIKGVNYE